MKSSSDIKKYSTTDFSEIWLKVYPRPFKLKKKKKKATKINVEREQDTSSTICELQRKEKVKGALPTAPNIYGWCVTLLSQQKFWRSVPQSNDFVCIRATEM